MLMRLNRLLQLRLPHPLLEEVAVAAAPHCNTGETAP
jgi:hypothetical protein